MVLGLDFGVDGVPSPPAPDLPPPSPVTISMPDPIVEAALCLQLAELTAFMLGDILI